MNFHQIQVKFEDDKYLFLYHTRLKFLRKLFRSVFLLLVKEGKV